MTNSQQLTVEEVNYVHEVIKALTKKDGVLHTIGMKKIPVTLTVLSDFNTMYMDDPVLNLVYNSESGSHCDRSIDARAILRSKIEGATISFPHRHSERTTKVTTHVETTVVKLVRTPIELKVGTPISVAQRTKYNKLASYFRKYSVSTSQALWAMGEDILPMDPPSLDTVVITMIPHRLYTGSKNPIAFTVRDLINCKESGAEGYSLLLSNQKGNSMHVAFRTPTQQ